MSILCSGCLDQNAASEVSQRRVVNRLSTVNLKGQKPELPPPVSGHVGVADEGNALAVGRPRGNIDCALAAVEVGDDFGSAAFAGQQTKVTMLVVGMVGGIDVAGIADDHDPLAVGRDVRKPVVEFVVGDLFLCAAVGLHSPDLHFSTSGGVEVNVSPIRGKLRTIVQAGRIGEANL